MAEGQPQVAGEPLLAQIREPPRPLRDAAAGSAAPAAPRRRTGSRERPIRSLRRPAAGWALAGLLLAACAEAPLRDDGVAGGGETVAQPPPQPEDRAGAPLTVGAPIRTAAPPPVAPAPPAPPAPAVAGPRGEILRAGARVVTTADLGDFVLRWEPDAAAAALRRLRQEALVESEAAREGVTVGAALVEQAAQRALDERLRRVRLEHGAAADVDAVLRESYGRTVASLRDDLRRAVRTDLLRDRLARLDAMRRDGVDLRVLVLPDERTAYAAAGQWREGADASLLARKHGVRPPTAPPAVALDDIPDRALRAKLAAASEGDVLPPVPFEAEEPGRPGESRTWWQVFKVVRAWKASAAPWSEVAPQVEASLRAAPAGDDEAASWEARAAARAGVSLWDPVKGFGPSPPDGTMPRR